jgi:hypothetical protein
MVRVTSREIMEALGIKNVKTLTRWHQSGVIPEPKVELHPDGNGRIACWPGWVLEHCRVVKQMLDEGQQIKDIVGAFGCRWQEIEARYPVKARRRRYNIAEVSQKMDRDRLLMELVESIYKAVAKQIVQLIESGQNAVLVMSSKEAVVVPDYLLSLQLARNYENQQPFLVVPIYSLLKQLGPQPNPLKEPTIKPVGRIRRAKNGKEQNVVVAESGWSFEVRELPD